MRRSAFTLVLAAVLSTAVPPPARAADIPVDLEFILAVDISRSMDTEELELQREGYVAALTHPEIIAVIAQGFHGRTALSYVERAGPEVQSTVMGWQVIDGAESAAAFAAGLSRAPRERTTSGLIDPSLID